MDTGWNDCRVVSRQSDEGRWLWGCGRPYSGHSRRRRRRVGLRRLRNLAGWRRNRRNSCGLCWSCDFGLGEPLAEEGLTVRLPGGLPYGAAGAGLFEPPSSSIRAKASSSRRCSTKRLEDLEIIAIAIPSAAVISTQPNIVL